MKKFFKKFITCALSFVLIFLGSFTLTGCANRNEILRLYVPGEYITNEVLQGFEVWYKEATGKNITVVKKEFDTNETMYTMVATKRQDYDVICPSDYMAERMKNEGLLVKISSDIMHNGYTDINGNEYPSVEAMVGGYDENTNTYENEDLLNIVKLFDENLDYVTPYMWGTMGIMYYYHGDQEEKTDVLAADLEKSSWTSLFDVHEQKIYMKDSERDTYTVALFNYYYEDLKTASNNFTDYETEEYQNLLYEIFNKGTNFTNKLENAKQTLKNQKPYVYDYETDEGKDDLLTSKGAEGYYGMFWSCDAGYIIADYSGDEPVYNTEFRYLVPEEGSNVWVDSFCIPKYASNKYAAQLFMLYMTDPDVAFECMDYTGCTSAIYQTTLDYFDYLYPYVLYDYDKGDGNPYTVEEFLELDDETLEDLEIEDYDDVFLSCPDSFKAMYLSLMFPNLDIDVGEYHFDSPLVKCGVMRDLGAKASDDLLIMWAKLRREIVF